MTNANALHERRKRRTRYKVRKHLNGRPRLTVHRTNCHIYAQLIDDASGKTLLSASSVDKEVREKVAKLSGVETAKEVGALIAARAKKAKINDVVFDRGGYIYHGRVKALADAARENGMAF